MRNNIILIWMPWSWKTTMARFLWMVLDMPVLNIDDYMEDVSWKHVWDILKELWDEKFLEFEKNMTLSIEVENTIISCSWSNPLKQEAMNFLRKSWKVIQLDTPTEVITKRLGAMKVDRIVWMKAWVTLEDILKYRKTFYDISYDYSFLNEWEKSKKQTFINFLEFFKNIDEFSKIKINQKMLEKIKTNYEQYLP